MNLAAVVYDLFDGLRVQAEEKGVTLRADVPDHLPPADADPQRLRQILLNLLSNALHHTPSGGEVSIQSSAISRQKPVASSNRATGWLLATGYGLRSQTRVPVSRPRICRTSSTASTGETNRAAGDRAAPAWD